MHLVNAGSAWPLLLTVLLLPLGGCGGESEVAEAPAGAPAAANAPPAGGGGAAAQQQQEQDQRQIQASGYGGEEGEEGYGEEGYGEEGYGEEGYGGEGYGGEGYGGEGYGEEGYGGYPEGYGEEGYGEEGYGEGGYGEGYGGGYGGPGNRGGAATAKAAEPVKEKIPEDYFGQAAWAFHKGLEKRAEQLLLAHLIAEPEQAGPVYDATSISALTRAPTWGLRWAAGLRVTRVGDYEGEAHPITADMQSPLGNVAAGRRGGYGGGGETPGYASEGYGGEEEEYGEGYAEAMGGYAGRHTAAAAEPDGKKRLVEVTGMIAETFLQDFSTRFANNEFGAVYPALPVPTSGATAAGDAAAAAGGASPSRNGGPPGYPEGYGEEGYGEEGYGEEGAPEGYGGGYPEGYGEEGYGEEGYGGEGYAEGYGGGYGGRQQNGGFIPAPVPPAKFPRVVPGMVYVGEGESEELLAEAREAGVDVLVQFDVKLQQNVRSERVDNDTRVRLVNVHNGETLVTSKRLNNAEVYLQMQRNQTAAEAVADALSGVFGTIDRDIKVQPLPKLTAAAAHGRVSTLLTSPDVDPLKALAEIRLYQHRGLLEPQEVELAADIVMGEKGLVLLGGSEDQQRETLDQWVERIPSP